MLSTLIAKVEHVGNNLAGVYMISEVVGGETTPDDSVDEIQYKMRTLTEGLRGTLANKGVEFNENEDLSSVISKIDNMPVYYSVNENWKTLPSLSAIRQRHVMGSVGKNVYCIGGNNSSTLNLNECYDTITGTWSVKTPLDTATTESSSAVIGNDIYVLCGRTTNTNYCYNTDTNT